MKCEICHANQATVHMTEVTPQGVRELHFCDECAQKKNVNYKTQIPEGLVQHLQQALTKPSARGGPEVKCPDCGMTYSEFRSKARLGCARDYEVFRAGLLPLIEKIHGGTQHKGKIPKRTGKPFARERELAQLEGMLGRLVKEEAFEKAAEVRNRIRRLRDEQAGESRP